MYRRREPGAHEQEPDAKLAGVYPEQVTMIGQHPISWAWGANLHGVPPWSLGWVSRAESPEVESWKVFRNGQYWLVGVVGPSEEEPAAFDLSIATSSSGSHDFTEVAPSSSEDPTCSGWS